MSRRPNRPGTGRSPLRRLVGSGIAGALLSSVLAACSSTSAAPTLTWYINPDNGSQATLAADCTKASGGKYTITTSLLPNASDDQREALIRRLAAKDASIDLMSLDPVFVAEFSHAGFLAPIPAADDATFTDGVVPSAVKASTWGGKLVAAPFWANTQLLWYRKSVAKAAGLDMSKPVTWQQVVDAAQKAKKTVAVQANQYEGYTVWINALVAGAGGTILENPLAPAGDAKLGLESSAGTDAANVIASITRAGVGGPALTSSQESQSLSLFQSTDGGFMVNWPYVWAASQTAVPRSVVDDIGWAPYPETVAGKSSRPPFGGIEMGIGAYSRHQALDIDAMTCLTSTRSQTEYMVDSGNPSARTASYSDPAVKKLFPMASLISSSLTAAAPRPQSPYYADISEALQKSFSPATSVTPSDPSKATTFITDVLKGDKLL